MNAFNHILQFAEYCCDLDVFVDSPVCLHISGQNQLSLGKTPLLYLMYVDLLSLGAMEGEG
jgi:hypothetical protein